MTVSGMREKSGEAATVAGKPVSLWIDTTPSTDFPALGGKIYVDVAILGGGIAGLTAAVLLKEAGRTVAVIEAARVVQRVTGNTTAKVTSLHGLIYRYLIDTFGREGARLYADANQTALERVAAFVRGRDIDCDFYRTSAYTYGESPDELDQIRREVDAAKTLGLPASFTDEVPLPFATKGAVRFDDQARFHPRKYLLAMLRSVPGGGSYIFENTRATGVREGEPCEVTTDRGALEADNVIVATHFPFMPDGDYFMKLTPKQSYVFGVIIDGPAPEGMFYRPGAPYSTIRTNPYRGGTMLLVGGEDNKTGQGGDIIARYRALEEYARSRFPVRSIDYHWTTEDNITLDEVPYVGRLSKDHEKVFVAAGFGGWGMTNGTVSGMILSDLILKRPNPWASLYDPLRSKPSASARRFVSSNVNAAVEFIKGRMREHMKNISELRNGEAGVFEINGEKVAVYRDDAGGLHAVSAICTHMGCTVAWDNAQKTWDCPCHGSRFGYDGNVIYGPATRDLPKKKVT